MRDQVLRIHNHSPFDPFKLIRLHPLTRISESSPLISPFFSLFFFPRNFVVIRINRLTSRKMEHGVDKEGNKGSDGVLLSVDERERERERASSSCLSCVKLYSSLYSLPFLRPFYTAEGCINRQRGDSATDPRTGTGESNTLLLVESSLRKPARTKFPFER